MNDILIIGLLAVPVVVATAGLLGKLVSLDDPSALHEGDSLRSSS
jgi:hypothetical protein